MYLPENNDQMFDILTELRLYAAMNGLPQLAEMIDDALMLLATQGGLGADAGAAAPAVQDTH